MKHWLLSAAALALAPSLPAEARRPTPKAPTEGMVSAADPRAAAAGVEILRAGERDRRRHRDDAGAERGRAAKFGHRRRQLLGAP